MVAPEVTPVEVVHGDGIDRGRINCRCLELDEAACTAVQKTAPVAIFPKGRVCKRPPLPKASPLPINRTVAIRGPPASWYGKTRGQHRARQPKAGFDNQSTSGTPWSRPLPCCPAPREHQLDPRLFPGKPQLLVVDMTVFGTSAYCTITQTHVTTGALDGGRPICGCPRAVHLEHLHLVKRLTAFASSFIPVLVPPGRPICPRDPRGGPGDAKGELLRCRRTFNCQLT